MQLHQLTNRLEMREKKKKRKVIKMVKEKLLR
jgi:hypothetical protein